MLPTEGVAVFSPGEFVKSNDTLILITDDQAQTNVAPLTTMLLGSVVDSAKKAAALSMTGRLDPPLRIVGDEIANVAPLPKLPGLLSDSRGNGIQWVVAFQSLAQVFARWGEDEGRQILANLNCSIALGGLQDEKALERFSALAGAADVTEVSASLGTDGVSTGRNVTVTERTVLRTEEIRHLSEGQALVIYRNTPAMIVNLIRWRDRPDGEEIEAAIQRVRKARIGHRP
jgi:type IV secretory pathway TraG/TraD family ATPase VirD4